MKQVEPGDALLTSLGWSAMFDRALGLGFVHPDDHWPGTRVRLDNGIPARVARLPFYDPMKRLPSQPFV